MATASKSRPRILRLTETPAVAPCLKRKAEFTARLTAAQARRKEAVAELARRQPAADPEREGEQLRAGQEVDFTRQDLGGAERELEAIDREIAALEAAVRQEQLALGQATVKANDDLTKALAPHLAAMNTAAAAAFKTFADVREERHELARELAAAGYADVGQDVAASTILATFGSATEDGSPMNLTMRHLSERGLVKL